MLSDTDFTDDIFSQDTTSKKNQPLIKFQPKAKKKIEKCVPPPIYSEVSQPNENDVTFNHHSFQVATGSSENTLMIDGSVTFENSELQSQQENLRTEISFRKNIASESLENVNFQNVSDTGIHKDVQKAGEDRTTSTRQLRKRNAVRAHDYDFEEENNEDSGPFNTQESDKNNDVDDSDYVGEKMPAAKKVIRKSKSLSGDNQKPGRKHRKLTEDTHTTKKEPVKKHFCHSTRRKRRRVDKLLLETPEDEIDERNLPMNVLIPLAEAREKLSMKETSMANQSNGNSSGRIFGDHHIDEESIFAEGHDRSLDDDELGVHPEAIPSSTVINYHSFMDKVRSPRWSKVDTELFYQAIRQFGTDFAMIQQLFPTRTRHQVKLKFKNEERRHPLQIADALTCRSKDNSQFEAVIQQLQASQDSSKDATNEGEASEWQDVDVENEEEAVKEDDDKSEEDDENGWDHKEDQDANSLDHSPGDAKLDEYQSALEW